MHTEQRCLKARVIPYWICGVAAVVFLASIAHFTPNAPSWDDYSDLDWLIRLQDNGSSWLITGLFEPHNEHRVVVLHLLSFISGANFQLVAVFGCASIVAAAFALFHSGAGRILTASFPGQRWIETGFALSISLFLYSPKHWEDSYWAATAATVLPGLALAIASLLLLTTREFSENWGRFALAVIAAIGSSLCQTNGFLIWPIGILIIALDPYSSRRVPRIAIWILVAIFLTLACFALWPPEAVVAKSRSTDIHRFIAAIPYFIRVVGQGFGGIGGYVIAAASLLIAMYAVVRHYRRSPGLLGILLFGMGSVAMLSVARADLPLDTAASPRYSLYPATMLLASLMMIASHAKWRARSALLLVIISSAYFVVGVKDGVPAIIERAARVGSQMKIIESTTGRESYSNLFAPPNQFGYISALLDRASETGIYALPRRITVRVLPEVRVNQTVPMHFDSGGAIDGAPIIGNSLVLIGWHMLPISHSNIVIHISGIKNAISSSYSIQERSDVARAMNSHELRFSGFELAINFSDRASAMEARSSAVITACDNSRCWRIPRASWRAD